MRCIWGCYLLPEPEPPTRVLIILFLYKISSYLYYLLILILIQNNWSTRFKAHGLGGLDWWSATKEDADKLTAVVERYHETCPEDLDGDEEAQDGKPGTSR